MRDGWEFTQIAKCLSLFIVIFMNQVVGYLQQSGIICRQTIGRRSQLAYLSRGHGIGTPTNTGVLAGLNPAVLSPRGQFADYTSEALASTSATRC